MQKSTDRAREVHLDTLLNSLMAERYVRGPLLLTIVDELSASARVAAARAAQTLLEATESGNMLESEFTEQVEALRRLVHRDA